MISQAHLDPVWLWPLQDGIAETLTTMRSAVDRIGETEDFVFTRSSAGVYRWIQEMDPRLFSEIQELVSRGCWEAIGGWIEQADCNLPGTESFFRQALYAQNFFRQTLGERGVSRIGYNVDSFGHAGGLPQILRATGFGYYVARSP